jgi:hypothetical protein
MGIPIKFVIESFIVPVRFSDELSVLFAALVVTIFIVTKSPTRQSCLGSYIEPREAGRNIEPFTDDGGESTVTGNCAGCTSCVGPGWAAAQLAKTSENIGVRLIMHLPQLARDSLVGYLPPLPLVFPIDRSAQLKSYLPLLLRHQHLKILNSFD